MPRVCKPMKEAAATLTEGLDDGVQIAEDSSRVGLVQQMHTGVQQLLAIVAGHKLFCHAFEEIMPAQGFVGVIKQLLNVGFV